MKYIAPFAKGEQLRIMLIYPEFKPAYQKYPVEIYFEVFFLGLVAVILYFFFDIRHLPNAS